MAKKSIFTGVLDQIGNKKNISGDYRTTQRPQIPNGVSDISSIEQIQQDHLDWQVNKVAHDIYQRSLYYDSDRINSYLDYRAMDQSPEVSAALDAMRDECLEANTVIPLLNGESLTIEQLFEKGYKDFYVYSFDINEKTFIPAKCERVAFKGLQDVYKIVFDDDSEILATSEHLWLEKGKETYVETKNLKENQSIEPFYTKISDSSDRINGYEMLFEKGKWEYTHRIVKNHICKDKKGVVHHVDFNKRNNIPNNLEVMSWYDHQKLHSSLNTKRWNENPEFAEKIKKILFDANKIDGPYWSNPEWRENRVKKMSEQRKKKFANHSKEELQKIFGYKGEKNPMFNNGHKISGDKNGRFIEGINREFTNEQIISAFNECSNINEACEFLNTRKKILTSSKTYKSLIPNRWEDLCFAANDITTEKIESACSAVLGKIVLEKNLTFICKSNGWNSKHIRKFLKNNKLGNWTSFVKKYNSKEQIIEEFKKLVIKHKTNNITKICKEENISIKQLEGIISRTKYKNFSNVLSSINHKVKRVEFVGKRKTYDLVNVGEFHNFAALTSNGTGIISHNCLTRNEYGEILQIYSDDASIKTELKNLFHQTLNINYNLRLWIRDLLKYGDYFVWLHIDKDKGIYGSMTLSQEEIQREEGWDGNPESVRFRWQTNSEYFQGWQVAHFRLLEESRSLPYGRSVLFPARKLWKQLQLAEDAMLVHRLVRAPERKIFFIEVGNLEDADVKQYVSKIQGELKKQPIVNSRNGQVNFKYDPMNVTEDYFIPVRGDKAASRIETLPGASNLNDIMDIQYLENKLFAALKVPKPYLNYSENMAGGSTLAQADLRFARTINTIQEAVLMELRRIANVHLYFKGKQNGIDTFTLKLNNPSTAQEMMKLETMKARLEVAKEFFSLDAGSFASYTWVMQTILGFSESEIKKMLMQKKVEKKLFSEIEAATETYKKIGLFNDIDRKFELPGIDPNKIAQGTDPQDNQNSFNASSSLGGGVGDMDMAGGPEDMGSDIGGGDNIPDMEAGNEAPAAPPEEPITEMINELFQITKTEKEKTTTELLKELGSRRENNSKQLENEINKTLEGTNLLLKESLVKKAKGFYSYSQSTNPLLEENKKVVDSLMERLKEMQNNIEESDKNEIVDDIIILKEEKNNINIDNSDIEDVI